MTTKDTVCTHPSIVKRTRTVHHQTMESIVAGQPKRYGGIDNRGNLAFAGITEWYCLSCPETFRVQPEGVKT